MHDDELVNRVLSHVGEPADDVLSTVVRKLRGGLEADHVVHVSAVYRDPEQRHRRIQFVVKALAGPARREGRIYADYLRPHWGGLCPRLLGSEDTAGGQTLLFLEALRRPRGWPWRDAGLVARVLSALAKFHATDACEEADVLPEWDYDAVLKTAGTRALESLERCGGHRDLAALRKFRPALRRVTEGIGPIRETLLACDRLRLTPLHGDVHTRNVLLRSGRDGDVPVLIDWARARLGSPLEDVSSWLQSLSYWEPEAARRHDTLLSLYLSARGTSAASLATLRPLYWIAAASNVLAGALDHHLMMCLHNPPGSATRVTSFCCARDCLRIVRRADALWR
jgi:hypothetical protein